MPEAWTAFDSVERPRNYDWTAALCLGCGRRWTWHRRAKVWNNARKYSIYRMLCPACLGPLTRVAKADTPGRFRVIPHSLVRMYLKSWPAERP